MSTLSLGAPNLCAPIGQFCKTPAIAITDDNNFIVVYDNGAASGDNLCYRTGTTDGLDFELNTLELGFASGQCPSVGLTASNNVVNLVVTFIDAKNMLCAKAGTITFSNGSGTVNWHPNNAPEIIINKSSVSASTTSVAINMFGVLIIAYQDSNKTVQVIGAVYDFHAATSGAFSALHTVSGTNPKVAVNNGTDYVIVHENGGNLLYTWGIINVGRKSSGQYLIDKRKATDVKYLKATGKSFYEMPAVALNLPTSGVAQLVEVHHNAKKGNLYFIQGQIDKGSLTIEPHKVYFHAYDQADDPTLTATTPAVALSKSGVAIAVCQGQDGKMYVSVSKFSVRNNWMRDYAAYSLGQLCIPGSHDAAMSLSQKCTSSLADQEDTKTQIQDIYGQLMAGIRHFDLRPVWEKGGYIYSGHYSYVPGVNSVEGCDGEAMLSILEGVTKFLEENSSEVVVFKFSHFLDKTGALSVYFFDTLIERLSRQGLIDQLIDLIGSTVPPNNLFVHTDPGTRITDMSIANIIKTAGDDGTVDCGKVIMLFDTEWLKSVTLTGSGNNYTFANTYRDLADKITKTSADVVVYDIYSHSNQMSVMASPTDAKGQFFKLDQPANHDGDLFVLSWTLTQDFAEASDDDNYTILQLAQYATGALGNGIKVATSSSPAYITGTYFPNIIYTDMADGFATDACIWLNQKQLRKP